MTSYRNYDVIVTRTVQINAANGHEAAQRGLELMQRQKAWPDSLTVTVRLAADEVENFDE